MTRTLRGLSDIRQHFFRDPTPVYYVCETSYYLMGMDEWVRGFRYINLCDCFDGAHPRVLVPSVPKPWHDYSTLEEVNRDLLASPEFADYVKANGPGRCVMFLFDEECVELAESLGLTVIFPPLELRRMADGKVTATRLADRAGVPGVPNALGKVDSWQSLRSLADAAGLGPELVVQTPYGDSGMTTFFIASEADFAKWSDRIVAETEVKVMRRIRSRAAAQEACVTKAGTLVGPLMTELIGFPELTPWKGGWAGNEAAADAFSAELRDQARDKTVRVGEELRKIGYRGAFELDYLVDLDSGELYLGEINPRITGVSGMTNLAAFAHADAPLFLFHLLEFSDIPFEVDVEALNRRWSDPENIDDWSQLILKSTDPTPGVLVAAPTTGVWRMPEEGGAIEFLRPQTHRRTVDSESEAFVLRHAAVGDHIAEGADLAVIVTRGRLLDDEGRLGERAQRWIAAVRARFQTEAL